ncbi:MAG: MATE family efflux transporter [Firmicutes bacterium]|nr:MATE family efflux transporter [Bacillota bacterium]
MNNLIGNKQFYKKMLWVMLPIALQNGITNFVSLLDNIMVGRLGTEAMSGVSVSNQLIFVYNLCIFGALSGAGIFTTQYYGKQDKEGIQYTFRYKIFLSAILTLGAILLLVCFKDTLISFYLNGEGKILETLSQGREYLLLMLIGLPAFMMMQVYATTLRECSETILPMKAGLIAVVVNLVGNYLLIYGKLGLPALGVAGAAIATVLSRYVEMAINIIGCHRIKQFQELLSGVYASLKLPFDLFKKIFITGLPLLLNETLWAAGMAMLAQCYSTRGLDVVAAMNISNTINNVVNTIFIALGSAAGIIIGQLLGAQKIQEAKETVPKMNFFGVILCSVLALFMCYFSSVFPTIYNTEVSIQHLATRFIFIQSLFMPLQSYINCTYFTLRAGGKTFITFLFDSAYVWVINVVIAFILSRYTTIPVIYIFLCIQCMDILKAVIGTYLLKKGVWIQTIVT